MAAHSVTAADLRPPSHRDHSTRARSMLEVGVESPEVPKSQRDFYEQIDLIHVIEPERTEVQLELLRGLTQAGE